MASLALVLGGARSGKSRFATELAMRIGGDDTLVIATAEACDAEMARRIEKHQTDRPAAWSVIETPTDIARALANADRRYRAVIIDCLTILVANLLVRDDGGNPDRLEAEVKRELSAIVDAARARAGAVIIVSGEVGQGVVPDSSLGRQFRDQLGWANQQMAAAADETYWLIAGLAVPLRSLSTTASDAARILMRTANG